VYLPWEVTTGALIGKVGHLYASLPIIKIERAGTYGMSKIMC